MLRFGLSKLKTPLFSFLLVCLLASPAQAEYRGYLIEVYDHILQKKWDAATGFDPQHYVVTHGGGNRLSVLLKATWVCYGDTGHYTPTCPMPAAKEPKFKLGEVVEIGLSKHMTEGWRGKVELSLWRSDLKANVYGIRFGDKKQMYGRYYEFNLKKTVSETPAATEAEGETVPLQGPDAANPAAPAP